MKKLLIIFCLALFIINIKAAELDIGVSGLDLVKYYSSEVEYIVVSGSVKNYGTQTITSFRINYQINNGQIFEHTFSVALAPNGERTFMHPEPIEPVIGSHTIKVWTSMPNGQEDEVPANDAITFDFIVYDIDDYVTRTILVEGFTSSTCVPCVEGNKNLKAQLAENQGQYALIKYQMSWPGNGDPYYTEEGGTRRSYYGLNSVPYCFIDGPTWHGNSGSVTQTVLTNAQANPCFVDLQVDYYVEGKTVRAKATINSSYDFSGSNQRLYLAVVEKITYLNRYTIPNQWAGEEEYHQVMKKFMPNASGVSIVNLEAKVPHTILQEWEFKGEYRRPNNAISPINHNIEHTVESFENLTIVAWIQNTQTRVVTQAANGDDTEQPTVEFKCLNSEYGTVDVTVNEEPFSSGNNVNHGENIIMIASPVDGYEVKEWKINGQSYTGGNENSIEITVDNYLIVSVEFKETPEFPCNTVGTDAKAEFDDDCTKATITWSAAEGEYTQAYRIMFEGDILEDNIQTTEYVHNFDFESDKTYSWEIITICEYGYSEPRTVTATTKYVGIKNLFNNLIVYPIPALTSVIIEGGDIIKVEVYNTLGYLIDLQECTTNSMDVSNYKKGQYIFKMYDGNGNFVSKLITVKK